MSEAKIKAIAPWFGSNRMLAKHVGRELRGSENSRIEVQA